MFDFMNLAQHYALPFVLVISIVVFVHEYGHYWVARRAGVRILTFSIGFGPEIFGWNDKHGTRWKVCWLPLGGYVKMFGDADPASSTVDEDVHEMTEEEKKVAFFHQSVLRRMAIVIAGPAVNYLFAIFLFAILFMVHGQPYSPPDVSTILENSAAASAGLKPGDHIVAIEGSPVSRFEEVKRIVAINEGTPLMFDIDRDGKRIQLSVTPQVVSVTDNFGDEQKVGRIGISTDKLDYIKHPPVEAVKQAFLETANLTVLTLQSIGQMIKGTRSPKELGGIISIAKVSGKAASDSIITLIWTIGFISINLGLINLMPIPPLDGGHLLFYSFEGLRGRPLGDRIKDMMTNTGLAVVFALLIFSNWNDIQREIITHIHHIPS